MHHIIHVQTFNNALEQSKISSQNSSSIMKHYHQAMPLSRVTFTLYVYAIHSIKMGKFMLAGGVSRLHYSQHKAAGGTFQEYIQDPLF
jgi:hypothetical protein